MRFILFSLFSLLMISCAYEQNRNSVSSPTFGNAPGGSSVVAGMGVDVKSQLQQNCTEALASQLVLQLTRGDILELKESKVFMAVSDSYCLSPGSEVVLQTEDGGTETLTRVVGTKLVAYRHLNGKHAEALGLTLGELQQQLWEKYEAGFAFGLMPNHEPMIQLVELDVAADLLIP